MDLSSQISAGKANYPFLRILSLFLLAFAYTGCSHDDPVPLDQARQTAAHASAASQSLVLNSDAFFFLPPLVPEPAYTGTFDGTLSPQVRVCELAGAVCGAQVASFSGADIMVDMIEEAYVATWKTKGAGLDPEKAYRIEVWEGTTLLGHVDLVVLSSGKMKKEVDPGQFTTVINGATLPIRFRIETGAIPPPSGSWQPGDFITYTHAFWSDNPTASGILLNNYLSVFPNGILQVGIPGSAGFSLIFTTASYVLAYLPATGTPSPLTNDLLDPTTSSSGVFGGQVVSLKINVDFSAAGPLMGTAGIRFGDLKLCNMTTLPTLNGKTVSEVLDIAQNLLGGGTSIYSITEINLLVARLNASFGAGGVSEFAQDHLVAGTCPQ